MKVLAAIAVLALSIGEPASAQMAPISRYTAIVESLDIFAKSYCTAKAFNADGKEAYKLAVSEMVDDFVSKYPDRDVGLAEFKKIDLDALIGQMDIAIQQICPSN